MAQLPTHAEWMKSTYSMLHPRSTFLKAVDEALRKYEAAKSPSNKEALRTAFDRWRFEQSKQGKDWKKSVRNTKGAATSMHRALTEVDRRGLSAEELEAMRYIARIQAMALQKQFGNTELRFKSSTMVGVAQGVGTKWQRLRTGAATVKGGAGTVKSAVTAGKKIDAGAQLLRQGGGGAAFGAARAGMSDQAGFIKTQIRELCRTLCPDLDADAVFRAVGLPAVEQFAVELAPFVGAISSGGKAVVGWIGVARSQYKRGQIKDSRFAVAPGDPEAAFDALLVLLNREIMAATIRATVKTGAFTGKTLGAFADAGAVTGPVVGLLEMLAEILQTVVEYVRDYRECQAANEMLRIGALNLDIFDTSPVLGCYFLVVQDHSTIINFAVGDYGTPNWMFDVERLVAKLEPVLGKAQQLILASRLELPNTAHMKGIVKEGYAVKTGLGKLAATPEHVKERITDGIAAWFVNPEKPPRVDPSRIVGFGPKGGGMRA